MKQLNLVVPGLLGPFADELPAYIQQQLKQSEYSQINKLLSRAEIADLKSSTYYEILVHLIDPQCQLSLCQLTAAFDEIDTSEGFYYRADPVHFKAQTDHAILIGTDIVSPTRGEAALLVESFNQHFLDDNLSLHFADENRWYLKSSKPLNLDFTSLDYALGRDIKHFMPQDSAEGEDGLWWRKILNEAQMLFFQHEVNQSREARGELTINGLWLWDVSACSTDDKKMQVNQLFTDEVMAIALAKGLPQPSGKTLQPVNEFENIDSSAVLVLDTLFESVCYGDADAWLEALTQFCKEPLQRIMNLLSSKKIDEIYIYPCNGQVYRVDRMQLLKFWKKNSSIASYI